jgi:hypothetical protein
MAIRRSPITGWSRPPYWRMTSWARAWSSSSRLCRASRSIRVPWAVVVVTAQQSTVTGLRSAWPAGVGAGLEGDGAASGWPQAVQNTAGNVTSWPQWPQSCRSRVPHAAQKTAFSSLACWHATQSRTTNRGTGRGGTAGCEGDGAEAEASRDSKGMGVEEGVSSVPLRDASIVTSATKR